MTERSPFPKVQISKASLPAFVFEGRTRQRTVALIDGTTGRALSYAALYERVTRAAAEWMSRGLKSGDVCAILGPNSPEVAVAVYSALMAGATVTLPNPLYTIEELTRYLLDCRVRLLLHDASLVSKGKAAAARSHVEMVVPLESLKDGQGGQRTGGVRYRGDLVAIDSVRDVAVLQHSFRPTLMPRVVMLTHRNLVANVSQLEEMERIGRGDVLLAVVPFVHFSGLTIMLNQGLHSGATVVTLPSVTRDTFIAAVNRYKVTHVFLDASLVATLVHQSSDRQHHLPSLREVLCSPVSDALADAFSRTFGIEVRQGYGASEASPVTHFTPRGAARRDSVGVAIPNTTYRIVDLTTKRDVPRGRVGELWVKGPQIMKGYLGDRAATREVLTRDGWLRTGTLCLVGSDGHLYLADALRATTLPRALSYTRDDLLRFRLEDIRSSRETANRVAFQALLLRSVQEAIVATDHRRRVTFWSQGAETLFGFTAHEAQGHVLDRLIVPSTSRARAERAAEQKSLTEHGTWHGQVIRQHRDGSQLWTDVVASRVSDENVSAGYVAIYRDITELREKEALVRESREDLRDLAAKLMTVREDERTALSREVHDQLGQVLTRLKIDIQWFAKHMPEIVNGSGTLAPTANGMIASVDEMIARVQKITTELRPAVLDYLGLAAALESFVSDLLPRTGCRPHIALKLDHIGRNHLRDTAVFRIMQEAITNVARHAKAKDLWIRGSASKGLLNVRVEDNGVGMAKAIQSDRVTLGLLGMHERAASIGGELAITNRRGGGTSVSLTVPLSPKGFGAERER